MGPASGLANAIKEDNPLDPNFLEVSSSIESLPNCEQSSPVEDDPAFSDDDIEEDDRKPMSTCVNANPLPPGPRISCEEEDDDDIPLGKLFAIFHFLHLINIYIDIIMGIIKIFYGVYSNTCIKVNFIGIYL